MLFASTALIASFLFGAVSAQHTDYGCQVFWNDNYTVGVICRTPDVENFKQCTRWNCWGFENHNWDDNTKFYCTSPGTKTGTKWTGGYLRKCANGDDGGKGGHCINKSCGTGCTYQECI
ncbi:hypothetical protein HDU97_004380 [Phlyctochytrium planicorne]|nr:hypothetical protein HDU97_004380 [Phlyctochytrium planicorne]